MSLTAHDPHKRAGHRRRLRKKFLEAGLAGFHDYEVIELLLTLETPRKDCKAAAKAALTRFKTLPGVIEASTADLVKVPGIGPKNLLGIKLIKAVADRYLTQKIEKQVLLNNSKELFAFLRHGLEYKRREHFSVIFLDAKNRVIGTQTLSVGTVTASSVYPREVISAALDHNAAAVIFAHNHPSGDPAPSSEDMAITRRLISACLVMGITVHEHIVIGRNRYYSFADQGNIAQMIQDWKRQTDG